MKVVYLGSGEFGIECLNALGSSSHSLDFIVTQPAQPAGRGRRLRPTPVARWAKERAIAFIDPDDVNTPDVVGRIAQFRPDLIVAVAFGQKIGNELITLPPKGAINVHASLLPKYRGAAPINWAIINGETQTGVSIICLAEKMDAGDILAQAKTDIGTDETAGQLHDRLARLAAPLLLKTLDQIVGGNALYARQDHSTATLAPKLKKSDGCLDFSQPAEKLRNRIRGLWPWPGASAIYVSKETAKSCRVTIAAADAIEHSNPSRLHVGTFDENLHVVCGNNALKITGIKPAGCSLMDFNAFVNGRHSRPGDLLVNVGCEPSSALEHTQDP
ncbi:MAG TPA: methionyl-tRNA formyltransferase [Sedimentisphaerales bacterium]|nr:methionyl-tRNA formyltransferase [Sedimentisphaerales bacterium]